MTVTFHELGGSHYDPWVTLKDENRADVEQDGILLCGCRQWRPLRSHGILPYGYFRSSCHDPWVTLKDENVVDGDRAAAAIGAVLKADKVVILTNVPGLLRDVADESSLIPRIPVEEVEEYLDRYAKGRMKRKILGAVEALRDGAGQVIVADGRVAHPLCRAFAGQGTVIGYLSNHRIKL